MPIILAVVAGLLAYIFVLTEEATLEVCNATPYTVKYSVHYPTSRNYDSETTSLMHLHAGRCGKIERTFKFFLESEFYVHAQTIPNDEAIEWVYQSEIRKGDQIFWPATQSLAHGTTNSYIPNHTEEIFSPAKKIKKGFDTSNWQFLIYDANLNFLKRRPDECDKYCAHQATNHAYELANAIERQIEFDNKWRGKKVPYFLAGNMTDPNGPFNQGVLIDEALNKSILDFPLPLKDGDLITEFDNETVFSPADLYVLLHKHATSKSKGIEVPINVEFIRNGSQFAAETTYFFNRSYWGYSKDDELINTVAGVTSAVTLGNESEAYCLSIKTLQVAQHGLAWASEKLSELSNNPRKVERAQTFDYSNCVWLAKQKVARFKQYDGERFDNAAWLSIITPSAPRLFLNKKMGREFARKFGNTKFGNFLATVTLETAENVIWTVNSASPLASTQQTFSDVKRVAPYAVGVGVVAGVMGARSTK